MINRAALSRVERLKTNSSRYKTTMDTVTEGSAAPDVDAEMTALTPEDTEQNLEASDEVEHLRNR